MTKEIDLTCLQGIGQMNTSKIFILVLSLITGCAGFYTKPAKIPSFQKITSKELNVIIEISFVDGDRTIDEIEISSKPSLNEKVTEFKKDIINRLVYENPGKKINFLQSKQQFKNGCFVMIKINEKFDSNKFLPTIFSLGLWPYIDVRDINMNSKLLMDDKLLSETSNSFTYKVIGSLLLIPLVPFKTVQNAQDQVWEATLEANLSKVEFNKCENSKL